ncbi:uncharacterized protein Z518_00821 [Rhinocladiella mackenziei CBS 650.93]|uniref:Rhinocladiella mackenziei CBS 650.93 unplaced genomic scaffold supercont1.1, whole genome shotgun sequence n=1 Tax=Rhinocladiella mackenziei CBS 650.93 TaxID=1442369 RepID=A0A0D2JJU8_9EURO|nr:uncharacterized protein Z518_00821 [Rhinocladiella mackenziei CBS 650.93]KIX09740.1 hypothetical protein Z518_00821 [Rhinocladiella mackenziei CBS 650.93]
MKLQEPTFGNGFFRLTRPINQNFVVGAILFCLPGIYLALTGLGAGGGRPSSQTVASTTNAVLYGLFTLFGWIGGAILNVAGPKLTIMFGAVGYPLYVGGLWYFDRVGNAWFPYFGGAILGVTAGCLWTAAGFIQFAYAQEDEKALFITWQWVLTSFGGTVGSLIAFGVNFKQTESTGVSNAVYTVFIVIMCMAIVIAFCFIISPKKVVRDDGTHLALFHKADVGDEIKGLVRLFMDWKVIALIPAIFVAEMDLALLSSINAYYFNLRTRSLNNVLFQFIMIPCPLILAYVMDKTPIKSRRLRGIAGASLMGSITLATNAGLAAWIVYNDVNRQRNTPPGVDWTDSKFGAGFILYLLSGVIYACYQIVVQWTLGALSNDPKLCARYAGLFKGTTSLGMCISFVLDAQNVSYIDQLIVQFTLYVVGLVFLFLIIWRYVIPTNYFLEENVIVPHKWEERARIEGLVGDEQIEREHQKELLAEKGVAIDSKGPRAVSETTIAG